MTSSGLCFAWLVLTYSRHVCHRGADRLTCSQFYLSHNKPHISPQVRPVGCPFIGALAESQKADMPHRHRPVNVEDDEGYVKDLYLRLDKIRIASLRAE